LDKLHKRVKCLLQVRAKQTNSPRQRTRHIDSGACSVVLQQTPAASEKTSLSRHGSTRASSRSPCLSQRRQPTSSHDLSLACSTLSATSSARGQPKSLTDPLVKGARTALLPPSAPLSPSHTSSRSAICAPQHLPPCTARIRPPPAVRRYRRALRDTTTP
jgi:hypothetical protein